MSTQKFLISVLVLGACSFRASASLVTYCSVGGPGCGYSNSGTASSAFNSATTTDTFQNIDVTAGSLGDSYSDDGVNFTDSLGLNGIVNPTGWPAGTAIASNTGSTSTMTLALPSNVSAIDFYAGMLDFSNFTISVTDSTGGTFSSGYFAQTNVMNPLFFGVTTNSTFTSITITSQAPSDQIILDDISIGSQVAPTPEAATLVLVGTGLFLMGYFRRRAKRKAAAQAATRGTVCTISTGITPA